MSIREQMIKALQSSKAALDAMEKDASSKLLAAAAAGRHMEHMQHGDVFMMALKSYDAIRLAFTACTFALIYKDSLSDKQLAELGLSVASGIERSCKHDRQLANLAEVLLPQATVQ